MMRSSSVQPRAGRKRVAAAPVKPVRLVSRCWCDSRDVKVTPEQVRNGETLSCGKERCVKR